MMISRKLAHKSQGRLQLIMSLTEGIEAENLDQQKKAVLKEIREFSIFLNAHIEDQEEQRLREKREERL